VRATPLTHVAALVGAAPPTVEAAVTGVTLSSREVHRGDLYAALPGARTHGARYAAAALEAGAVAVLTDEAGAGLLAESHLQPPQVVTPEPRAVLGRVCAQVYGTQRLPLQLVGVTGTNGKTTTAYLVQSALEALGRRTGLIGTVETRIGGEHVPSVRTTPEAPELHALLAVMAQRGVDCCVMEVSSHALSQHRVDGVVYDVALFTNLSQDHLDFHGTMEDYFAAKASLFTPERARSGVVCVDDDWGRRLAAVASVPVVTVSSTGAPATYAVAPDGPDPAAFLLTGPDLRLRLRSALPGGFNVVNTAMAALALHSCGVPAAEVERALAVDPHVPGRMERVTAGTAPGPCAIVDYAHTPDAVAAALRALRPTTTGSLVVVLGAGGDRDRGKRQQMGRVAAENADIVFVTDDNPRSEDPAQIRAAVLDGARAAGTGTALHDVPGRAAAITEALAAAWAAGPGSTVAVVGKGHESGQEVGGTVHPFDDREEVRKALHELHRSAGTRT
jgi:UDP-N-acetylmuramoyl-L-alanyl-D-glutamate--2,6-diaminopimelate ligase